MTLIAEAYQQAKSVLQNNFTNYGFVASPTFYKSVWGRDGSIACLAAHQTEDKKLLEASRATLDTLSRFQSDYGELPAVFHLENEEVHWYATDSTAWWLIAAEDYLNRTQDKDFAEHSWDSVKRGIRWLASQRFPGTQLILSHEGADWMDASIKRRGIVLYNNCLFYRASLAANKFAHFMNQKEFIDPKKIKNDINTLLWPSAASEKKMSILGDIFACSTIINKIRIEGAFESPRHYLNFITHQWFDSSFASLGNLLAVIWDIASAEKRDRIFEYITTEKLSDPYPLRVLDPPATSPVLRNYEHDQYTEQSYKNYPYCYHNSGIWPFVGGFYVLALQKCGKNQEAQENLEKLAEANRIGRQQEWEFNEWLYGKTGKPSGAILQSWSAAGYILAYISLLSY